MDVVNTEKNLERLLNTFEQLLFERKELVVVLNNGIHPHTTEWEIEKEVYYNKKKDKSLHNISLHELGLWKRRIDKLYIGNDILREHIHVNALSMRNRSYTI